VNLFVDRVTVRLIDGTNLGGPAITFPRPELNQMFGSTQVIGTRAFAFQPLFGCLRTRPLSIAADVAVVDSTGATQIVSANAAFQQDM
jgi:hypothetical protein